MIFVAIWMSVMTICKYSTAINVLENTWLVFMLWEAGLFYCNNIFDWALKTTMVSGCSVEHIQYFSSNSFLLNLRLYPSKTHLHLQHTLQPCIWYLSCTKSYTSHGNDNTLLLFLCNGLQFNSCYKLWWWYQWPVMPVW